MAVPKKRTSKSRRGMRRSHDAIKFNQAIDACTSCGEPKLRHHVCEGCGTYRGRQVTGATAE
jgi:large subunit ribosomal protein L32